MRIASLLAAATLVSGCFGSSITMPGAIQLEEGGAIELTVSDLTFLVRREGGKLLVAHNDRTVELPEPGGPRAFEVEKLTEDEATLRLRFADGRSFEWSGDRVSLVGKKHRLAAPGRYALTADGALLLQ